MINDNNQQAQYHWNNAAQHAQSAQHALEDAARALQQLGPVSEGHEYAARVTEAQEHMQRATNLAKQAATEYELSDAAWNPIPQCTLGL